MKKRYFMHVLVALLSLTQQGFAQDGDSDEAKTISGISIIGNAEAPKSLYIVPWRSSDIGMETDLSSSLLNEGLQAVDKDVFLRELDFFEISTSDKESSE